MDAFLLKQKLEENTEKSVLVLSGRDYRSVLNFLFMFFFIQVLTIT